MAASRPPQPRPGVPHGGRRGPVIPMRLALYQPDIPQNTGALLRLAAVSTSAST